MTALFIWSIDIDLFGVTKIPFKSDMDELHLSSEFKSTDIFYVLT